MKINRWIPFRLLPGSWGLSGKVYEEAEACYCYIGEGLDRRLVEINHRNDPSTLRVKLLGVDLRYGHIDAFEYDQRMLEVNGPPDDRELSKVELKHGRITEADYDLKMASLDHPEGKERDLAVLASKLRHGQISKLIHDKEEATLTEMPWIGIIDQGFDLDKGVNGVYFEFDWNSFWIDYLRLNGYGGQDENVIVEQWFQDVCQATAAASDGEALNGDLPMGIRATSNRRPHGLRGDDGTFYS